MPICNGCKVTSRINRVRVDKGKKKFDHACDQPATCPCQHRPDAQFVRDIEPKGQQQA